MAYRQLQRYRRMHRNTPYRRGPLTKPQKTQVRKIANTAINRKAELKCLDNNAFDISAVLAPADFFTGIRFKLTMPAQGDADGTRDGDTIYLKSLSINAIVDCSTAKDTIWRAIVVQWEDDDADTPLLNEVLLRANGSATPKDPMASHYVCKPVRKFKILSDKFVNFDANNDDANKIYKVRISEKQFMKKKIQFGPAALTGTGQVYMFVFADIATAGAQFNRVSVRWRYYDG